MNPEKADASTQEAPSGCLSPFGLWVILWLLIVAAVISYQVHYWPQIVVDDWPDGGSSNADYWYGGRFLGHPADRIRRVATYRGDRLQQHSLYFFAAIPMDGDEFQIEIEKWRKLGWFEDTTQIKLSRPEDHTCPEWFPFSSEYHVGAVREWGSGRACHMFRRPGDDHVYFWN